MSVSIIANNVPISRRGPINYAVRSGIGKRPVNEKWEVFIYELPELEELHKIVVTVKGPDNFGCKQEFCGLEEEEPEFIQREIWFLTHQPASP